ncbi:uncharacterized protein Y057_7682 [Fusarium fujikuroi]|nr:uncharacterized protein Y057_7682 [Fusarium fujikuroi]
MSSSRGGTSPQQMAVPMEACFLQLQTSQALVNLSSALLYSAPPKLGLG